MEKLTKSEIAEIMNKMQEDYAKMLDSFYEPRISYLEKRTKIDFIMILGLIILFIAVGVALLVVRI